MSHAPDAPDPEQAADRLIQRTLELFEQTLQEAVRNGRKREADPASMVEDRYAFRDALDGLAEFSGEILSTAEERLRANLTPDPRLVDPETGQLTIIEPGEIELHIYLAGLCSSVTERQAPSLQRLQSLVSRLSPLADTHALDPDRLLGALAARIVLMGLTEVSRRIACSLLFEALEPRLADYYRRVAALLETLPATAPTVPPAAVPCVQGIAERTETVRQDTPEPIVAPEGALQSPDSVQPAASARPAGGGRTLSAFERETVLEAFTALQKDPEAETRLIRPEDLVRRVATVLYEQGAFNTEHLSEAVAPVARFVYDVFRRISSDSTLPEEAKRPLAALQIPVTKLAFMDLEAFHDPQHPARRLLQAMTGLALHADGPDGARVLEGMQRTARHLNRRFDRDPAVVEHALHYVTRLLRETERRADRREQEAQARRRRQARMRAAKKDVLEIFRKRAAGRTLHPQMAAFLKKAWLPCMIRALAFRGAGSTAWRAQEYLLEQLLLIGSASMTIEQFDTLVGSIDSLEHELRAHLDASGVEAQEALGRLMRWLRATRFRAVQTAVSMESPAPTGPPTETIEDDTSPADAQAPGSAIDTADIPPGSQDRQPALATPLPPSVRPGIWFEIFVGGQRARRRLKLSTVLMETGEVLFATRSGEEALTLPLEQFLEDLREGRSRPIEDTNRFEGALQAVIRRRVDEEL